MPSELETKGQQDKDKPKDDGNNDPLIQMDESAELIAESKKYRKRAQSAEAQLEKLQKDQEEQRQKQLAEQEKWKELADEYKDRIDQLEPQVESWKDYQKKRHASLLEKLPDSKRENYESAPIELLEVIVKDFLDTEVPDTAKRAKERGGYDSLNDAANAYTKGKISFEEYEKIRQQITA